MFTRLFLSENGRVVTIAFQTSPVHLYIYRYQSYEGRHLIPLSLISPKIQSAYSIGPVYFMVGDNRLLRAPCTHPIFDDIHAHSVRVQKAQLMFSSMHKWSETIWYAFSFIIQNWTWITLLLIIRKTKLCLGCFSFNVVWFFVYFSIYSNPSDHDANLCCVQQSERPRTFAD